MTSRPWKPSTCFWNASAITVCRARLEEALRPELKTALKSMFGPPDHINEFLTVAQAVLRRSRELEAIARLGTIERRRTTMPTNARKREELRIRALQAILYRKVQGTLGHVDRRHPR